MKTKSLFVSVSFFFFLISFLFTSLSVLAQPNNDTPCGAFTILPGVSPTNYPNIDASSDDGEVYPPAGNGCTSQNGWCASNRAVENSVWFKFIAPSSGNVTISTCNTGTNTDTQIALYKAGSCSNYSTFTLIGANDDLFGCSQNLASSLDACVIPGTLYYLQIDGYNGDAGNIYLSVSVGSDSECIDCPLLGLDVGTPCNDGNSNTIDDVITSDCECQGIQPCFNVFEYTTHSFNGSHDFYINYCTYEQEYNIFENTEAGNTYRFTSVDEDDIDGFITIRSGTPDGAVVGYGYSPVTVIPPTGGTLYAHYNVNGSCETSNECVSISAQCITCPKYCLDLDLLAGTPCNDGNTATINDVITNQCECSGEQSCLNFTMSHTETFDGTDQSIFNYNSNGEYNIYQNAESGSQYVFESEYNGAPNIFYPGYITVRSGNFFGPVVGSGYSPLTVTAYANGSLYVHYSTSGNCENSVVSIIDTYAYCSSCPHYCSNLGMTEGDPCNDFDPNTNYDVITEDCECEGISPCLGDTQWGSASLTGSNQTQTISTCNFMGDFSQTNNVEIGENYTFISTDIDDIDPVYITVRSGSINGAVLGSGYSPLTVTSNVNGSLYTHYSADEFCSFSSIGCFTSTVQCVTCPVYCESLDLVVGAPCDDDDPNTNFDIVTEDCECEGTFPCVASGQYYQILHPGTAEVIEFGDCNFTDDYNIVNAISSGEEYTFTSTGENDVPMYLTIRSSVFNGGVLGMGYSPLTVTALIDAPLFIHINSNEYCGTESVGCISSSVQCNTCVYDCPILNADIGDSCNDNDPNTINDVVTAACTCAGEPAGAATFSGTTDWTSGCTFRPMAISLYNAGTDVHVATISFNINSAGTFSIPMDFLGTFDVYIKINGYLRKGFYNYAMAPGDNTLDIGALTPGDLNGDNGVNIADVSVMNIAFGSVQADDNYNLLADLNCDGGVNIVDVSALNLSFGMVGVPLP